MKKKTLALVLALTLLVAGVVGGTLAWLTDQTAEVKNTFTVGDINIGLTETTADYKMVPGNTIAKDPTVTVKANSEACWLFVKVTESANLDDFITYAIATGWTELEAGVYYREVPASAADQTFSVLAGDAVTVKNDVTIRPLRPVPPPSSSFRACISTSPSISARMASATPLARKSLWTRAGIGAASPAPCSPWPARPRALTALPRL